MRVASHYWLGTTLLSCLVAVGCSNRADYNDVQAARENVREEQQKTAEVRQESAEEIASAERNEQALRHEVLKPSAQQDEAVRDAEAETAEARQDAAEAVHEQQKDTAEAKAALRDTEARFAATKARDEFVTAHDAKLKAASDRIASLKDRASKEEGAAKDATEAEITKLQTAHDQADDALDKVKSETDVLKWAMDRENVQQAFNDLQTEMDQSK